MNIDIQEETESKYVINSLQVIHMATSMKKKCIRTNLLL